MYKELYVTVVHWRVLDGSGPARLVGTRPGELEQVLYSRVPGPMLTFGTERLLRRTRKIVFLDPSGV